MPIYDYACTSCGRVVEVVHGINGQGPASCETCGGSMKKLMSSPAVHFKGSGWAKKDRRSNGSTTKAAAHAAQGGGGAESADGGDKGRPSEGSTEGGDASRDRAKTSGEGGKTSNEGGKDSREAGTDAPASAPTAPSTAHDPDRA